MSRPDSDSAIEIAPPAGTGPTLPRREFLRLLAAAAGAGAGGLGAAALAGRFGGAIAHAADAAAVFPDGIKSGDPLPDGSVLWARIAPARADRAVAVTWSVAEDPAMERVVRGGLVVAQPGGGHHAKVRVRGLAPDRWYHYRFEARGVASTTGRVRTAPALDARPDRLRYAFASCQQRTESHYVAHRAIARDGVDFLLHLGDYVYVSDGGTLSLDDYRGVYHRFHSNPLLQELQAAVPLVAVWDDGEFYNGVDRTGPPARLASARAAWFDAMPVERRSDDRLYRALRWGRLANLSLLDTRMFRDPEVPANTRLFDLIDAQDTSFPPCDQMFAPGRTTLGRTQRRWLELQLVKRTTVWNLIGSSYDMAPWKLVDRDTPELRRQDPNLQKNGGIYVSNEAWDDYQSERRELMRFIARARIPNVVVSSGHTHFFKASDIQPDCDDLASPITAMEFVTGSQTADPDPRTIAPEDVLRAAEELMLEANDPYLKHVDLLEQGYTVVDVTPEETIVDFRGIDTYDASAEAYTFARFRVVAGRPGIERLPVTAP